MADTQKAANPFLMNDGAARMSEFSPQHEDPGDGPSGPVPDEVWASEEFQDQLFTWTKEHSGPSLQTDTGERKVQYIRPNPGFVFKTVDKTSNKIFCNVCSSIQVPEPPKATIAELQNAGEDGPRMRIPISLGAPRQDTDKEGKPCTIYDACFHPEVIARAKIEPEMKEFVVEMCMQWIEQKHSLLLNRRRKWPKGMEAKGQLEIQVIRRNTNQLFQTVGEKVRMPRQNRLPGHAAAHLCRLQSDAVAGGAQSAPEAKPEEQEEEPEYVVREETMRLAVVLSLPRLDSAATVELEHSSKRLFVHAPGAYKAAIPLQYSLSKAGAVAEFNKLRTQLTVWLTLAVPATPFHHEKHRRQAPGPINRADPSLVIPVAMQTPAPAAAKPKKGELRQPVARRDSNAVPEAGGGFTSAMMGLRIRHFPL